MRVIIYRDCEGSMCVGTESDQGTAGELLAMYPGTPRGELSAFIAAQNAGTRLGCRVYLVRVNGDLLLVQRKIGIDKPAESVYHCE